MAAIDRVLGELERVRPAGKGWIARCPAHEDRSASLSVSESDNGNALVHCFAGCSTRAVVEAMGLRLSDLFAKPLSEPERKQRATHGLLKGLCAESLRVVCAAPPTAPLNDEDRARLKAASARLRAALSLQGLQGRDEIRKIADFGDRMLAGESLDETEREALTDCAEWLSWLIADEQKPGGKARPQEANQYA